MRNWLLASAAILAAFSLSGTARADQVEIGFSGAGVTADLQMTIVAASPTGVLDQQPNANYPVNSFIVTAIAGTFSDTNIGIINASITGIVAPNFATAQDPGNILAPHSFSILTSGLTYDNLFYPNGSPQVASDWPFFGGFFDIYGLAFILDNGDNVNLWSNGFDTPIAPGLTYGVAVESDGVVANRVDAGLYVPEPASLALLGTALLGFATARRRKSA